jgi:ABC-type iron transport system FetAB permease component
MSEDPMSFTAAPRRQPERSPWRWLAAALAVTIAAAHVPVTREHLAEAPYIGWSFIALEIVAVTLAYVLVLRDTQLAWTAATVVPTLAILGYALTRSVALPEIGDDVGNWTEPLGVVALSAEALLAILALGHRSWRWPSSQRTATASVVAAGLLLLIGLLATGYAASINGAA